MMGIGNKGFFIENYDEDHSLSILSEYRKSILDKIPNQQVFYGVRLALIVSLIEEDMDNGKTPRGNDSVINHMLQVMLSDEEITHLLFDFFCDNYLSLSETDSSNNVKYWMIGPQVEVF